MSDMSLLRTDDLSSEELLAVYNTKLRNILDEVAPIKTRKVPIRPQSEWYSQSLREAKQERRQAERAWRKSGLEVHRRIYIEKRSKVNALLKQSKEKYYKGLILD